MRRALSALALALLLMACADSESSAPTTADAVADVVAADAVVVPDVAPDIAGDVPLLGPDEWPDAGDEAWVARAVQVLMGRKPFGVREVQVLADFVAQTGRVEVALALMTTPEYEQRWTDALMDHLQMGRSGDWANRPCMAAPLHPMDDGAIARHIRANGPAVAFPGGVFNLHDVFLSSLRADDVSAVYRAQLFPMLSRTDPCNNPTPLAREKAKRHYQGERFNRAYTYRDLECAHCHNSEFSTTGDPDPALDRTWEIPGLFEKAIWGSSTGRPADEIFALFRHLGVIAFEDKDHAYPPAELLTTPWSMAPECGEFVRPALIDDDPLEVDGYFTGERGRTASIWDLEASLGRGVAQLADGLDYGGDSGLELDPDEAFAWLVASSIVNDVWLQVHGAPLTLVHHFPRNQGQRDLLLRLTEHFIEEGWSLRTLLTDVLTEKRFNLEAPERVPNAPDAHPFEPVLDPWSVELDAMDERGDGPGDGLHRARSRVLLSALTQALEWPAFSRFPEIVEERFHKAVGSYLISALPGFDGFSLDGLLFWENRLALCRARKLDPRVNERWDETFNPSCEGYCGGVHPDYCFCDDQCVMQGDCCDDYFAECDGTEGNVADAFERDWIDDLLTVAGIRADATVGDVVVAVKDRLIQETAVEADEAALLAQLFGVADLAAPFEAATGVEDATRRYCGILLKTPQFMMIGAPAVVQKAVPKLVVNAQTERALCFTWAERFPADAVSCDRW